jgi:putative tricarboxylic transport membrane protein
MAVGNLQRYLKIATACAALLMAGPAAAQDWRPAHNVEIVVGSGAGGSADRSARVVQKLLSANPAFPSVSVVNRPGGGGTVAFTYLSQHPGDAGLIGTVSATAVTNYLIGVNKFHYSDFTPLAILLREYQLVAVRTESPIANGKDLLERLRRDPGSVSFAFASSAGNQNHVIIGMILRAAGADVRKARIVVQKSGSEAATAMLGGHIDVFVGAPANVIPHIRVGRARAIGISAPQRQGGALAGYPTLREQGMDAVFSSWRGFFGPKGLTPQQVAFWDQAFAQAVKAEEWKMDLERNAWSEDLLGSAATRKHLDAEEALLKGMLAELGVMPAKQ